MIAAIGGHLRARLDAIGVSAVAVHEVGEPSIISVIDRAPAVI